VNGAALVVIAKAPVAGQVKTRLSPPCSPTEAAALAEAALADTCAAVAEAAAGRRIALLEGRPGAWLPEGFEVIPQADGGLDARLAAAFEAVGGPALVVAGDTPQVTPALLEQAAGSLDRRGVDAVLGGSDDGGYWAVGLRVPCRAAFLGVPMSRPWTGRAQRARFASLGLECAELPVLRDIDTIEDALAVAGAHPGLRFSATLASIDGFEPRCARAAG